MADISDWDVDTNKVSVYIYENERIQEVRIRNKALDNMTLVSGGQGAISYVTKDDLEKLEVREGETDSVVKVMRAIGGVEIVAFLKEKDHNVIRVSYRAKSWSDVSILAIRHNGGGHKKAAGCTLYMPIREAVDLVTKEIEEYLAETSHS